MGDQPRDAGTGRYDPGVDAAHRYPEWIIRHRRGLGVPEVMCPVRRVILIEHEHDRGTRRSSLAHAVAHIDLKHTRSASGILTARQEAAADRLAARRLLDVREMAAAMLWAEGADEVAEHLDVDMRMLVARIRSLHPTERHYLRRRLETKLLTA